MSAYDLTTTTNALHTGSLFSIAGAAGTVSVVVAIGNVTGSWGGIAHSWGVNEVTGSLSPTATGSWGGVSYSHGTEETQPENIDRSTVTSDGNPSTNQGVSPGSWSPFPAPAPVEQPVLRQRDITRFRKSYSSQRLQPRPIRIIRG